MENFERAGKLEVPTTDDKERILRQNFFTAIKMSSIKKDGRRKKKNKKLNQNILIDGIDKACNLE